MSKENVDFLESLFAGARELDKQARLDALPELIAQTCGASTSQRLYLVCGFRNGKIARHEEFSEQNADTDRSFMPGVGRSLAALIAVLWMRRRGGFPTRRSKWILVLGPPPPHERRDRADPASISRDRCRETPLSPAGSRA